MLRPEENERLARVGPGTPMGNLLRRYWQPALLSEELPEPDAPPVRVRLLGEDLIAFRDSSGTVGIVDAYCPHRRAPMFFGRNEECGLRCVYHGWKFSRDGTCVDMPSEPPDSLFRTKVRIAAYPTYEAGGIVFAYLGPPESNPGPPDYELLRAPATHRHVGKTLQECNWLQALEGGIDSTHFSYLHCMDLRDRTAFTNRDKAPRIESERTPYGLAGATIHRLDERRAYVRTNHYILPAWSIRARITNRSGEPEALPTLSGHVWVPLDDERCWVYNWLYAYDPAIPVPEAVWIERELSNGRGPEDKLPDYRLRWDRTNDYGLDRSVQKQTSFTGIRGANLQDVAIQEGMGAILDRSHEHLAPSDRGIILMRQLLLEAVAAVECGEQPRGVDPATYRDVRAADFVVSLDGDWRTAFAGAEVARF